VGATFALGLAAVLAAPLGGADTKKPDKNPPKSPYAGFFVFPKQVELDKKQKEQLAALQQKYTPRLLALDKKYRAILTPGRVKAAEAARQKAADAGKTEEELTKVYLDALRLTEAEQKELKGIGEERVKWLAEVKEKKLALLTAEQKELLKPKPKGKDKDKDKKK
jgi:hypothetical protein